MVKRPRANSTSHRHSLPQTLLQHFPRKFPQTPNPAQMEQGSQRHIRWKKDAPCINFQSVCSFAIVNCLSMRKRCLNESVSMRLIGLLWWWKFFEFPPVSIYETTNMFKMSFGSIKARSDFKNVLIFLISNGSPGFELNRLINLLRRNNPCILQMLTIQRSHSNVQAVHTNSNPLTGFQI